MKILQVIPSIAAGFGGPSSAVLGMSSALSLLGQEVRIITTDADVGARMNVPLAQPQPLKGFEICYYPVRFLKHYKFSPGLLQALRSQIPAYDVVHIHSLFQFSTLSASFYCRRFHKPHIIRPLGHLDPYALKHRGFIKSIYMRAFELNNLNNASAVHYTSTDEMRLACGLNIKSRPLIIGLGVDLEEFSQLPDYGEFRQKHPELKEKKIILFFGRINFKKGLDLLVEAFAGLAASRDDLYLVIAGPDDEGYAGKVKGWLKSRNVSHKSLFTGMLSGRDKLCLLRDSDIFVLPSYTENFALAVVEAMAAGLPVVVSERVGISADISDCGCGVVVPLEAARLEDALNKLLKDEASAKAMGQRARALAREKFGWGQAAQKLLAAYKEISGAQ